MSCVNTVEVEDGGGGALEEETTEARLAAARNAPYPISKKECLQGWDTLIHKCWLRCTNDACNRWGSVPEAVRDEVRPHASHPSRRYTLHRWRGLGGMPTAHAAAVTQRA